MAVCSGTRNMWLGVLLALAHSSTFSPSPPCGLSRRQDEEARDAPLLSLEQCC